MKAFFFLLLLLPCTVIAQENPKYLAGAIPEVDGKVVFKRSVSSPQLSTYQIFAKIMKMAQERFKTDGDEKGRVLYSNPDKGSIVCWGEEYMIFTQKALVLDRAQINFQVVYTCKEGVCEMEVSRIRYLYSPDTQKPIYAENWITDKYAYDQKRNKLIRGSDKFRIKTIDLVDNLEKLVREALQAAPEAKAPIVHEIVVSTTLPLENGKPEIAPSINRAGYQRIMPAEINGNFINMLINGKLTITVKETTQGIATQWGGIGYLFNRPVIYSFVIPSKESDATLDRNTTYTLVWTPNLPGLSLYKEIIFECRKMVSQSIASESISGDELKKEWSGKAFPKLYTGEIVSIWVK